MAQVRSTAPNRRALAIAPFADAFDEMRCSVRAELSAYWLRTEFGPAVAAFIAAYLEVHDGRGPTRAEVTDRVGIVRELPSRQPPDEADRLVRAAWRREPLNLALVELRHLGWISYDRSARSLRCGHRWRRLHADGRSTLAVDYLATERLRASRSSERAARKVGNSLDEMRPIAEDFPGASTELS